MNESEQIRTVNAKKGMLEALENHLGIVSLAVKDVGIARSTHYKWLDEDEEYKTAVAETIEGAIDFVESQLYKRIKDGDTTSIIFYLKTRAKKRGYVERQEISGPDGNSFTPPQIIIQQVSGLPALKRVEDAEEKG